MENKDYPERTCVVCKKKDYKTNLFKVVSYEEEDVLDKEYKLEGRSRYVCKTKECLTKASKMKKNAFSSKVLYEMSQELGDKKSNIKAVLMFLKQASKLCFGLEMTMEALKTKKASLLIIANDISEKSKEKIEDLAKEKKVRIIVFGSGEELGEIFSKENVGVIGITDKKAAIGFAKKWGGEQSDS